MVSEGHAEVNAFASVSPEDEPLLKESTIYVSLEPCAHFGKTPPCCDLIISKGIRRVVVGCVDPFAKVQGRGIQRIREAGIEVTVGVLEKECQWLNRRFFTFHKKHRPYIILKWAQTDNGFIDDHGHPLAISSPFTKMLVHQQRAREDAIVVGRLTAEKEQPQLNVRTLYEILKSMIFWFRTDIYKRKIQSICHQGSLGNSSSGNTGNSLCLGEIL